jgi:hypothetical protein
MPNWEQQQDGTFLPSADLVARVRANRAQYPDAVSDFAKITGKSHEEVQSILDNPGSSGFLGTIAGAATDVGQGLLDASAVTLENLVPESILGSGGQAIRDFSKSLDPKFDTEKGVVEHLTEGVGQALPTVAATIGTGGFAGLLLGAGVSTLTFADEDNFANAMNEIAPGVTPDILVVNPEDDEGTATAKALVTNIVTDALFMGTFQVAGKALSALKRGAPVEEIKAIAKESAEAVQDVALPAEKSVQLNSQTAYTRVMKQVKAFEETKNTVLSENVTPAFRKDFHEKVYDAMKRLEHRSDAVAGGVGKLEETRRVDLVAHVDKVVDALERGDHSAVVSLLKKGVKPKDSTEAAFTNVFQNSLLKKTLDHVDANFNAAVALIRENPDIATRDAFRKTLNEFMDFKGDIGEVYRLHGSSASYILNDRKGMSAFGGYETLAEAEDFVKTQLKDAGFNLFTTREDFIASNFQKWEELGIDATKVLPELDRMFDEFDKGRQGILANMKQNASVKMTPEQRAAAAATFVRTVKEIQAASMLGQLSTTGLEVVSNTINNMVLPIMEHVVAKGDIKRAAAEYAGYASALKTATGIAKKTWVAGKGVLDEFDITEGAHSSLMDYSNLADKPMRYLMVRIFKFASDLALASSEFWKSTRAFGLAYADGLEMALKAGEGRVNAKAMAREYAKQQFDETGRMVNAMYRNDVSRTSWQQALDTRYGTGKFAQAVDNVRNRDDLIGLTTRSAIPFFKTLVNIGSDSLQYIVPPGTPAALRAMAKTREGGWLNRFPKMFKALDDFTGANGAAAQARAVGRYRIGNALTFSALAAAASSDKIELTGASGGRRWDAKKRAFEEYPPNSLVIGDTSIDLNRLLPFSAPLMLAGMLRDMDLETKLHMENGVYTQDNSVFDALVNYAPALVMTNLTLFQDSGAARGIFDLITAFDEATSEGNPSALLRYMQQYASQFTPGPVKMLAKNTNLDQYEGYDFYSSFMASAGLPVGYKRLDFLGKPVTHGYGRGLDPLNIKALDTDDDVHREFIFLNKTTDLAVVPPRPDAVFDKSFWKSLGVDTGGAFSSGRMPSLTDLETIDGRNGWDAYRAYLYEARLSSDVLAPTSGGDRVNIGKVLLKKGETFSDAITRLVEDKSYQSLTPDARTKVWNGVFNYFKRQAKDQLKDELIVNPEVFQGSRYGNPISSPATIATTMKAAEKLGASTQQTQGSPLDAAFAIK